MKVAALNIFPVKALAGLCPAQADVEPWGLAGDRRWMVVDRSGRFLSQRTFPCMATLRATPIPAGLRLEAPGREALEVALPRPEATRLAVTVWRSTLPAALATPEAADWLSTVLNHDARLVHMHDPLSRPVNPAHGLPGETTSFADGYPVLLTSLSSLADLNTRLARPVPISRFRANIVVEGAPAWVEDTWRMIRIGKATFRVVKPCDRCIVTTIDQQTGARPDRLEPLRTLGKFRHDERGIMFGQNLVPAALGRVSVGDEVVILEAGRANVLPIAEH